jgi:hypothetical protein
VCGVQMPQVVEGCQGDEGPMRMFRLAHLGFLDGEFNKLKQCITMDSTEANRNVGASVLTHPWDEDDDDNEGEELVHDP